MAIMYVDLVGGSDANNGSTFALRKKTISAAASAMSNGDTMRIMQSPDPTSVGSATWTEGSNTVTLGTACTAVVDNCESGWTASTNVTGAHNTTAKEGTNGYQMAVLAAFTTGLIAYKTISSIDLSGYQQLSFWWRQSAGTLMTTGDITISLCSDTAGATAVNTFTIPAPISLNNWHPVVIDLGTNLGSTIQSVAIRNSVDRAAQTFQIDHIIACKASSSADSLNLQSLIGLNGTGDGWYAIRSINGTSVVLDGGTQSSAAVASGCGKYGGSTTTATTYKRETHKVANTFSNANVLTSSKTYSGGWDSTSMSSLVGDTYIDGLNGSQVGMVLASACTVSGISLFRYATGFNGVSNLGSTSVTMKDLSNHNTSAFVGGFNWQNITLSIDNINGNGTSISSSTVDLTSLQHASSASTFTFGSMFGNIGRGVSTSSSSTNYITLLTMNIGNMGYFGGYAMQLSNIFGCTVNIGNAKVLDVSTQIRIGTDTTTGVTPFGNTFNFTGTTTGVTTSSEVVRIGSCSNNTLNVTGTINAQVSLLSSSTGNLTGSGTIRTLTVNASKWYAKDLTFTNEPSTGSGGELRVDNYNATAGESRLFYFGTYFQPQTSVVHTASSTAWRYGSYNNGASVEIPLSKVAMLSGAAVTAKIWTRRANTGSICTLFVKGGEIPGVSSTVSAVSSAAVNTWEQLTITFTPSSNYVGQIYVSFTGNTTGANSYIYIDDFEVTQ